MEPKNILDQNTRTVISTIKKENYGTMELKKILDSENENRKRNKIILFLKKLILNEKDEKIIGVVKPEMEKIKKKVVEKPMKKVKEKKKDDNLIDYKNSKGEPIKLKLIREYGGYKEYIDEKTDKKYSLEF